MEIAIHLGAHCTDGGAIAATLARDADRLAADGIVAVPSQIARPAMRRALREGGRAPAAMIEALSGGVAARRIVLSQEGFLGAPARALGARTAYADIGIRAGALRDLFADHEPRFHLAIRNPATLVPLLFDAAPEEEFDAFLADRDPARLDWSRAVTDLCAACPDVPLTVWCNEDLPLIWPEVLAAVAGVTAAFGGAFTGEDEILRRVLLPEGLRRLTRYMQDHPAPPPAMRRKAVTALLGQYADAAQVEPEIDLPGWTEDVIDALSDAYARDVGRVRALDGVTFLDP